MALSAVVQSLQTASQAETAALTDLSSKVDAAIAEGIGHNGMSAEDAAALQALVTSTTQNATTASGIASKIAAATPPPPPPPPPPTPPAH